MANSFDPENPTDISRLRAAMVWSERRLRAFRTEVVDSLRQYVGFHYGEGGASDKVPINMIELGVDIFKQELISGVPQCICTPRYPELRPGAADLEIVTNHQVRQMDLEGSLSSAVTDAMFGWGVIKIGVATDGAPGDEEGFLHDSGQVFADSVLFEDFFCDMMAKRWEQVAFMGNHFRVALDWARDNPLYEKEAREGLSAKTPMLYDSDRGGNSIRSESLSQGSGPLYDEYRDRCELIEVWLPEDGLILTLGAEQDNQVLRVVKWTGPKHGPYRRLGFGEVPGNLVPKSPVSGWKDLHEAANLILNKVIRQAERQKTITGVPGHAKEDGSRVIEANDGDMITVENPGDIKEFMTGGPNQASLGMVIWARDLISYMAGNLEVLGGLAPQTKTVGQDRLLNANASGKIRSMQQQVVEFTTGVLSDVAWHVWNDPLVHIPFQKPIRGTNLTVPAVFTPERRSGEFFDYVFEVDPFSLQTMSPSEKADAMTQFVMQMYPQLAPMMQQSGIGLDWEFFFKTLAKYRQLPELERMLTFTQGQSMPQPQAPQGAPQQPAAMQPAGMPANTTRNYVRENVPQGNSAGRSAQLAQLMFGGNTQPAEKAGLVR